MISSWYILIGCYLLHVITDLYPVNHVVTWLFQSCILATFSLSQWRQSLWLPFLELNIASLLLRNLIKQLLDLEILQLELPLFNSSLGPFILALNQVSAI